MTLRIVMVDRPGLRCRSASFFGWQRIWVDTDWYLAQPMFARRALIAHECAHLHGHHTEWRALTALLAPWWLRKVCHWQEYRADARAAAGGHTHGLLHLLQIDRPASLTHPKNMDRREKLMHSRAT